MPHRFAFAGWVLIVLSLAPNTAAANPSANRETPLVKAIRRVRPAVVSIHSRKIASVASVATQFSSSENRMNGMGTGVIVDARGFIVTNYHVIEDTSEIRVTLVDGTVYAAEVVGRDPQTDLALLRIQTQTALPVMPMGAGDDLLLGESVVAIGNAFGYEHTVTRGIISELHREVRLSTSHTYHDLIQTDASINPGNSGGPLVNADGEMIGLNVAIRAGAQGIGFAIPVKQVFNVVERLLAMQEPILRWRGLSLRNARDAAPGKVIVESVSAGSAAETASIRPGDRLISVDGREIRSTRDLTSSEPNIGAPAFDLRVMRSGREHRITLSESAKPARAMDANSGGTIEEYVWNRLGLRLTTGPAVSELARASERLKGGLQVVDVAPNGPAKEAGIAAGDVLVGLTQGNDDWETVTIDNVAYVLRQFTANKEHLLRFFVVRSDKIWRGHVKLRGQASPSSP